MTITFIERPLKMDRIEVSLRYGANNFVSLNIINDIIKMHKDSREAFTAGRNQYPNNRNPSFLTRYPLLTERKLNLHVETGAARDREGKMHPYAKFTYNAQRLITNPVACQRFHQVIDDLVPNGGYSSLLEDSYVNYVEFAADFFGIDVNTIDAYSPQMTEALYISINGNSRTTVLNDGRTGRPCSFCLYDKKQADWDQQKHLRRGPYLRVEARRRLNRTPTYRELRLCQLSSIPNPFESLRIYDREIIQQTFTAIRDRGFRELARTAGVQEALMKTSGADKVRRLRMLENCRVEWWSPEIAWAGRLNAINRAYDLN